MGYSERQEASVFFIRKVSVYLTELVIYSFNKPLLSCCYVLGTGVTEATRARQRPALRAFCLVEEDCPQACR